MKRVDKPWGYEIWWAHTDRYVGKLIFVKAGNALSLQYHEKKSESMYCQSGTAELTLNGEVLRFEPGEAVDIPVGMRHRLVAITDVTVFEVSTPEVEDVVRLEDRYGREGTSNP